MRVASTVSFLLTDALYFLPDLLFVAQSLVADSLLEELVEVEVIAHQELNVRRLKLQCSVPLYVRMREYIGVEGPTYVGVLLRIPLESGYSNLKGVHPSTGVLDLLVAPLGLIKAILNVLLPHRETTEFSV